MKTSSGRSNEGLAAARRMQTLFKASAALGAALTMAFFAFGITTASAQIGVAAPGHAPQARAQGPVPGQYIVVFDKDVQMPVRSPILWHASMVSASNSRTNSR